MYSIKLPAGNYFLRNKPSPHQAASPRNACCREQYDPLKVETVRQFAIDMSYPAAHRRRVYLACRAIFTGNNALLRKQKKIRELVVTHKRALQPLVADFGANKVVDILKLLLEAQIFQLELKVKIEFPDLFCRRRCEMCSEQHRRSMPPVLWKRRWRKLSPTTTLSNLMPTRKIRSRDDSGF
jgi:hypothetical protein